MDGERGDGGEGVPSHRAGDTWCPLVVLLAAPRPSRQRRSRDLQLGHLAVGSAQRRRHQSGSRPTTPWKAAKRPTHPARPSGATSRSRPGRRARPPRGQSAPAGDHPAGAGVAVGVVLYLLPRRGRRRPSRLRLGDRPPQRPRPPQRRWRGARRGRRDSAGGTTPRRSPAACATASAPASTPAPTRSWRCRCCSTPPCRTQPRADVEARMTGPEWVCDGTWLSRTTDEPALALVAFSGCRSTAAGGAGSATTARHRR